MDIQQANFNITRIRIFTALASLLLSLQAVYFDDIINRDGIMYLQMVDAYLTGGLEATRVIYNWPVLSILIAWLHQLTGVSIENSALFLNSLFFILLTDTLVRINTLLVKSDRQLFIAATLILGFLAINEYRDFIMRDFGYWAFCSLALYQFMLFIHSQHKRHAVLWQVYILIAVLFRIEGLVVLLLLPLFCFFKHPFKIGLSHFFQTTSILFIGLAVGFLFLLSYDHLLSSFGKLTSLLHYLDISQYFEQLKTASSLISENILNKYSEDYGTLIFISGLLTMMFVKLIKSFSISYILIYILSFKHAEPEPSTEGDRSNHLLLYFLLINILILTAFLLWYYFLSSRYMGMALITLLLLSSYTMSSGIEQLWKQNNKFILSIIGLSLFYSFADAAIQSSSKTYIKETTLWAAHNIPPDSKVLTDDEFVMYYFERDNNTSTLCVKPVYKATEFVKEYTAKFISKACTPSITDELSYYDYLIVVEKRRYTDYKEFLESLDLELLHRKSSKKDDHASVYRVLR